MYANYGFDYVRLAERYEKGRGQDDYHRWLTSLGLEDQADTWKKEGLGNTPQEYRDFFSAVGSNLDLEHYSSTWIGNESVRYLQAAKSPFFLWVNFAKPASPYDPPRALDSLYKPSELKLPADFRLPVPPEDLSESAEFDLSKMTRRAYGRILANYYTTITHMDAQIGRILATLTGRGHSNNIVVFSADRGDYMGQHGLVSGRGAWPYDALIRVPLIVSGVTGQRRGEVDKSPAQLTDLMPTLLRAAHVPVPESVQGRSLLPLLRRRDASLRNVATYIHANGIRVARTAQYKMMALPLDEAVRFHDLKNDPGEHKNIAGDRATVRHQVALRNILRKLR
jgi:arylsulfatase A-like enzyme